MTVKYSVVPKKDPRNLEAPQKILPDRRQHRPLGPACDCEPQCIAQMSTGSSVDTIAVREAFLVVIPQELASGNIVGLDEFGTFRLTVLASGEDRLEDVGIRNIKKAKARFKLGNLYTRRSCE